MEVFYAMPATPDEDNAPSPLVQETSKKKLPPVPPVPQPQAMGSDVTPRRPCSPNSSNSSEDTSLSSVRRSIESVKLTAAQTGIEVEHARRPRADGIRMLNRQRSFSEDSSESKESNSTQYFMSGSIVHAVDTRAAGAELDVAGTSNRPDVQECKTPKSESSTKPKRRDTPRFKRRIPEAIASGSSALKAAHFQIGVKVIKAKRLVGRDLNYYVCVSIGEQFNFSNVVQNTNNPEFDKYFVFNFLISPIALLEQKVVISLQNSCSMTENKFVGLYTIDVAIVWNDYGQVFYHKWVTLTDPDDVEGGAKGFLMCDIYILGKGQAYKDPPKRLTDIDSE